ncbi:MAG: N-acetyl-gamma-glutamyl-phosphate reductase [Chitinophagaceae bacterium]|nr:N-acetyl-gamma-glutamyl-phosphate reductase [Chitinophagaceae bacterium]
MAKLKAGIVGGAGYTGGELLRILLNHPDADIAFVHSKSNAGNPVYKVHADLTGETKLQFTSALNNDIDVLFLCTGHGEARKFLAAHNIAASIKVIDLSNDFRLAGQASIGDRAFVYGLPELNREAIRCASNIANPGCFATAIQLGLLPLAKAGLLKEVYTTGITGSTGAGQALSETSHFSWRANNIQPYKTFTHQHLGEIGQSMAQLAPGGTVDISFVPWRGDFTRGIFISSQLTCPLELESLYTLYNDYYSGHPFITISREPIFMKQVVNTNKAVINLEKAGGRIAIHSAIDNLLKGASGQAVQNMNLLFGLEETAGLKLKSTYF